MNYPPHSMVPIAFLVPTSSLSVELLMLIFCLLKKNCYCNTS